MRMKAGYHWLNACSTEPYLSFEPVNTALPGTKPAGFHQFISSFNFVLHILLYYAII
jgi:hypothetical protein